MAQTIIKPILGLLISYLIGSIPTGYLFGRWTKGIDLRQHGSGNLGATNAFRVLGKKIGAIVLILDILKGAAAILLARFLFYVPNMNLSTELHGSTAVVSSQSGFLWSGIPLAPPSETWWGINLYLCLTAVAVVSGHNWTCFLGFKGGKGVATTLGALIAFSIFVNRFIWLLVCMIILWLVCFLSTGLVSLASIIASISLPIAALFFRIPTEIIIFLALLGGFSVFRHKSNILRILQKKESRFDTKKILKKFFK